MLLSIIIPMYNSESYIGSCLDSILCQGIDPKLYEIIIVNDGSLDKSCQIVERYMTDHPNIKLFSQENKGQSAARNLGMENAQGDYVQFVDSDDYLIPDSLKQIVQFALDEETISYLDMITFGIIVGTPEHYGVTKNNGTGKCLYQGNGYDYIASHNYNNSPCYYWLKRDFVNRSSLHFEAGKLCEDGVFTLSALLNASSIAEVDSKVYYYVERPNSTVTTTNPDRVRRLIEGFEFAIDYFDKMITLHQSMGEECKERVLSRRDSYTFFLLIRLLKMGTYEKAAAVTSTLKASGVYPLKHFPNKDYPAAKFKIITTLLNQRQIYITLCKLKALR